LHLLMSQDELFINGELLRLSREARGWVLNDMATRACMSVKQIRQLEEGGVSAFYSIAVKVTAAKKVAALLGVSADDVFGKTPTVDNGTGARDVESQLPEVDSLTEPEPHTQVVASHDALEVPVVVTQPAKSGVVHTSETSDNAEPKSKTSLLTIAVLFAVALAAAAYLQPKEDVAVEMPPPVQVLPADATDAASAASASEVAASGVEVAAKPSPVTSASATASAPRAATPVASAPVLARPASAAAVLPAASAASKAP
jgi:transcriptional regulator with XRE-family HTH domain